ncbi:hypothetical protein AAT19DRAFT_12416 [Rhodotorula toruloides]|uniref:Uncharacterized protein n=1 Tax=Rhodotorula toruloides TaxID=5286 RepID=A0A2T0AG67_RHOTO|nr:hypothetical protein AAT19DRAFT_12416 [Rhodotorula toruloides]
MADRAPADGEQASVGVSFWRGARCPSVCRSFVFEPHPPILLVNQLEPDISQSLFSPPAPRTAHVERREMPTRRKNGSSRQRTFASHGRVGGRQGAEPRPMVMRRCSTQVNVSNESSNPHIAAGLERVRLLVRFSGDSLERVVTGNLPVEGAATGCSVCKGERGGASRREGTGGTDEGREKEGRARSL